MPFSQVETLASREAVWQSKFRELYRDWVRPFLSKRVLDEFRDNPRGLSGHHSDDLQKVLTYLRTLPLEGFPVIYVEKPFAQYHIAHLNGVRQPVDVDRARSFASEAEAAYHVFIRRLQVAGLEIENV